MCYLKPLGSHETNPFSKPTPLPVFRHSAEFSLRLEIIDKPEIEDMFWMLLDNNERYAEFLADLSSAVKDVVVEFMQRALDRKDLDVDVS